MHSQSFRKAVMRRPIRIAIPLAALITVAAVAAAAAAVIPIYSNDMSSTSSRSQLVRLGKGKCDRGASKGALSLTVGKATRECKMATPVVGANLDLKVTARLSQSTPTTLQKKTFVAVALRDGEGGQYQLAVFPAKGTYQLRRDLPPDAARTLLGKGTSKFIKGVGKPNKLRLQGFPTADGGLRLAAFVNGHSLAAVVEDSHTASTLGGRSSTLSVGSAKAANGARASFDELSISLPDPF
jgi:hypothetical protein